MMRNDTVIECDLWNFFVWEQIVEHIRCLDINQRVHMLLKL